MSQSTPNSTPSKARRIFKFLGKFLLIVIVLLILLAGVGYALIWQPRVQQQLLQQFTQKMSKEWQVVFRIDSMVMEDFSHYKFYNFYLEDPDQDTLLCADVVEAQGVDLWEIWENKRIAVGKATVKNAVFKVQRTARQRYFSLDYIIDYFNEEDPLPMEERFKLSIDTALVEQIYYKYTDASNGIAMTVTAQEVYAAGREVDLIRKKALLDSAYINQSYVYIKLSNPIPIPDSVPPSPYNTLPEGEIPPWHVSSHHIDVRDMVYYSTEPLPQQAQHHQAVWHNKKGKGEANALKKKQGSLPDKTQEEKNKELLAHNHQQNKNLTNLHFRELALSIDSFELHQGNYKVQFKQLTAAMPNGFKVQSFQGDVAVTPQKAVLKNFRLKTKESSFGNTVVLHYDSYNDLKDFIEKVEVAFNLYDCHFTFSEIGVFVPSLMDNVLIKMNQNTVINISGEYQGLLKYFSLTDIDIQLGEGVKMDKKQAAKKTPVEWLIKVFGPKNKERQAKERAARKAAREAKRKE